MKSVQVFPRLALATCVELLDDAGVGTLNADQATGEWFAVSGGDLEVSLSAYGADQQFLLETAAHGITDPDGQLVAVATDDGWRLWLEVRVSARAVGQNAMLGFVDRLLVSGGYVQDDYSDRLWTAAEVHAALAGSPGPRA